MLKPIPYLIATAIILIVLALLVRGGGEELGETTSETTNEDVTGRRWELSWTKHPNTEGHGPAQTQTFIVQITSYDEVTFNFTAESPRHKGRKGYYTWNKAESELGTWRYDYNNQRQRGQWWLERVGEGFQGYGRNLDGTEYSLWLTPKD